MFTIFHYPYLIIQAYFYFLFNFEIIALIKFTFLWPFILLFSLINNCFLFLDHLFFRFNKISINQPFFVTGFPRSGTTFLHKTISHDQQFTTPVLWEMLFAPSIIQKIIFWNIYKIFSFLFKSHKINFFNSAISSLKDIHNINLNGPEEDYLLLIPYGGCFLLILMLPVKHIWNLDNFDNSFSLNHRDRLMKKYKQLIQRHLYYHGENKIYLSKNPSFTSFSESLKRHFPDCKLLNCYRDPSISIPSLLSTMQEGYLIMSRSVYNNNHINKYIEMYKIYSTTIKNHSSSDQNYHIVHMDSIKDDLFNTVSNIYQKFNYLLSQDYKNILEVETEKSKNYKSKHQYDLKDFNLNQKTIDEIFKDIKPNI